MVKQKGHAMIGQRRRAANAITASRHEYIVAGLRRQYTGTPTANLAGALLLRRHAPYAVKKGMIPHEPHSLKHQA